MAKVTRDLLNERCTEQWRECFLFLDIIYLLEGHVHWQRSRNSKIFYLQVHLPGCRNRQSWIRMKTGTENFIWVCYMSIRTPKHLSHPLSLFACHQRGAGSELKQLEHRLASIWDVGVTGSNFTCCVPWS